MLRATPLHRYALLPLALVAALGSAPALADGPEPAPDAAPLAAHVEALRKRLPEPGFAIVVEAPFVVVGDLPEKDLTRWATGTIRWAVRLIKEGYFEKDPARTLDIWLFKDKASYERNVRKLFGEAPSTPFGYYSRHHGVLVMNIATGGGTLVHELVHPYMEANFPACPSWLNEGLASLYEQCREHEGKIWGLTNWRLAGLKEAIRANDLPSTRELLELSDAAFYESKRGNSYAQARYLCYYLQEKGLLRDYVRRFREGHAQDPHGFATLKAVLGEDDMAAFDIRWRAYVLGLEFPER